MRIVGALKARNHLAPVYEPASEDERQARRERQAAEHAHAVVSAMNEIPRRELDFNALGGRAIEHVASADGAYYRPYLGDPPFTGPDVTMFYINESGVPCMLERCTYPSGRADLERIRARQEQRRTEQLAARKALWKARREALR